MRPIPCACNEPSQHFLLYVPSSHKQPRLEFLGLLLEGVLNLNFFAIERNI